MMTMKNRGIIPIDKPKDWTSFDVVNKLKFRLKPLKVGHLGTLDPMATGVLLVTVGKATKLFDLMQEKKKTYVATFEFGYLTDTLDSTGKIVETCAKIPSIDEILEILPKFKGKISQIPPKYSAKSINGKRAYDLARNNVEFELKAKLIEIYNIKLLSFQDKILNLEIECGSGTYIRSIGRDIAQSLNSMATMTDLVRTRVGNFDINKCCDVQSIEDVQEIILPIKEVLDYETLNLSENEKFKLLNGQTIIIQKENGIYQLADELDTVALIEVKENKAKMSVFLG